MNLKVKRLRKNARLPLKATAGAAGFDLFVAERVDDYTTAQIRYLSGIAVEIPPGYCGLLFPRSSVVRTPMRMANAVGVIDSDYRGEITAVFDNHITPGNTYRTGDRFAQLVIVTLPDVEITEEEELSRTARGFGGYGSTGL